MRVYRISKQKFISDLSGTGASIYGGRWNHKNTSLLYTSEHISLAVLEILVHVQLNNLPGGLKLLTIEVPDDVSIKEVYAKDLPENWINYPSSNDLADIGSQWVARNESLMLKVPSAIVPEENNLLINPGHSEFKRIKAAEVRDLNLDNRLSN